MVHGTLTTRTKQSSGITDLLRERVIFESLYQPRLEGELKDAESDLDLNGKCVQVVGYVQQQELGNCFLSFHIVEPAIHPADGFD